MEIKNTIKVIVFCLIAFFNGIYAQTDSSKSLDINTEITLASRNIWRGLDYGTSPAAQGTLALKHNYFEVGAFATTTLNGNKGGYGTWIELYGTAKYKKFS